MIPTPASPMGVNLEVDRPYRPGRSVKPAYPHSKGGMRNVAFKLLLHNLTTALHRHRRTAQSRNIVWCIFVACVVSKAPVVAVERLGLAAASGKLDGGGDGPRCADACAALLACVASQQLTSSNDGKDTLRHRRRKLRQYAALVAAVLRIVDVEVALSFAFGLSHNGGSGGSNKEARGFPQQPPNTASPTSVAEISSQRTSPHAPPVAAAPSITAAPPPPIAEQPPSAVQHLAVDIPPAAVAEFVPVYPPTASPLTTPLPSPSAAASSSSSSAPEAAAPDPPPEAAVGAGAGTEDPEDDGLSPLPVAQLLHFDQEADPADAAPPSSSSSSSAAAGGGGAPGPAVGRRLPTRGGDDEDGDDGCSKTVALVPVAAPAAAPSVVPVAATDSAAPSTPDLAATAAAPPRWQLALLAVLLLAVGAFVGVLAGRATTATATTGGGLPAAVSPPLAPAIASAGGGASELRIPPPLPLGLPVRAETLFYNPDEAVSAWLQEEGEEVGQQASEGQEAVASTGEREEGGLGAAGFIGLDVAPAAQAPAVDVAAADAAEATAEAVISAAPEAEPEAVPEALDGATADVVPDAAAGARALNAVDADAATALVAMGLASGVGEGEQGGLAGPAGAPPAVDADAATALDAAADAVATGLLPALPPTPTAVEAPLASEEPGEDQPAPRTGDGAGGGGGGGLLRWLAGQDWGLHHLHSEA